MKEIQLFIYGRINRTNVQIGFASEGRIALLKIDPSKFQGGMCREIVSSGGILVWCVY